MVERLKKGTGMDVKRIRAIVDALAGSAVEEIRIVAEGSEVHVRFAASGQAGAAVLQSAAAGGGASGEVSARDQQVTAPMPGVVYRSPAPGEPAFVRVGQAVTKGQTLLLIEAMKSMSPVVAPCAGEVVEIPAADEAACDAGAVLVVIRQAAA